MSYHSLFYTYKEQLPWTEEGSANAIFPMAVAMTEMGLSAASVRSMAKGFLSQHNVLENPKNESLNDFINHNNWKEYLGKKEYYQAFTIFFEKAITDNPEGIREYFAEMADGIFGYDFMVLIRLAYAFESGQKEELARALAFLAAGYQSIRFVLPEIETKVFIEHIVGLKEKAEHYKIEGAHISDKVKFIADSNQYAADFAKLEEENLNIFTLRALAIRLVREISHPVMKQIFCAVHAFRVISPLLPDVNESIQQFYMVMQAAYLALGCPELQPAETGAEKSWPLIFQLTGVSKDIPSVLFIYSCFKEYQFAQSTIYPEMAYSVIHNEIKLER